MDWKLEVVVLPVSEMDRAKQFYSEQIPRRSRSSPAIGALIARQGLFCNGSSCQAGIAAWLLVWCG